MEIPLMPKDECTETDENIIGEDCINPSYQKKTKSVVPKAICCFLGCFLYPSMKYGAVRKSWPLSPQVDHLKTEQKKLL